MDYRELRLTIFWSCIIGLIIMLAALVAHGKTTSDNKNSLGVIQYQENPYSYLAGNVIAGYSVEEGKGLVIRVQPLNTYSLFTEDILLCGSPLELFSSKSNPIVLTYEKKAARMVSGVGCHTLIRIDEIKTEQIP